MCVTTTTTTIALNDDVNFIISKHLASDLDIRRLFAKNHDLQKILFGNIALDYYLIDIFNFKFDKHLSYVYLGSR